MSDPSIEGRADMSLQPAGRAGGNLGHAAACFLVGCFAGALASFFPRLMAILARDPTQSVTIFSTEYLIVGATVAVIVGIVILIVDSGPGRGMRDVFMTALGIPTLLMGALSTTATSGNVESLQKELEQTTAVLRTQSGIGIHDANEGVPKLGSVSSWQPWDVLGGAAYADDSSSIASPAQNSLGIAAVQRKYFVVYGRAADKSTLEAVQAKLNAAGIATQYSAGTKGDTFLVPRDSPVKPYAQAVQSAVSAKQAGATPYLIPATGN